MNKILINLFSKSVSETAFKKYSNDFAKEYEVYNYHFTLDEIFPEIVEAIIKQIQSDSSNSITNTTIVFQTNIADLAHFSAKVYSEILDGVVVISEETEFLTKAIKEFDFINRITQYTSSQYRITQVFLHENKEVNFDYLLFLFKNKLLNDIAPFSKFQTVGTKKNNHNYCYILNEGEYTTSLDISDVSTITISNVICDEPYNVSEISEPFGLFKLLNMLLESDFIKRSQKVRVIQAICENVKNINHEKELKEFIMQHIDSTQQTFENYIDYVYICMVLGDKNGVKRIYEFIKKNIFSIEVINIHGFITNSLFYVTKLNQNIDAEVVKIRLELMAHIKQYWKERIKLPKKKKRKENHIAIVAGQLLLPNHAPTKWVLDYANLLKKSDPTLKIKIFVEDWANNSPNEITWLNWFESASSKSCALVHKNELYKGIEVYYSDSSLNRKDRLMNDIKEILAFEPSIIYKVGSKYNLAVDLLYDFFPVVSHTMGGAEDSNYVDLFTGGYKENVTYEMYKDLKIDSQEYMYHRIGIATPKSNVKKLRQEYGLSDSDFVLITVGNRLDAEISEDFVKQIEQLIKIDDNYKWLLVGTSKNRFIQERETVLKNTIFIPYEQNLFDLYKICDVFVNPIRQAGGNSAAIAMKAKLPIITTNPSSDIGHFVGQNNCINLSEYVLEIEGLKNNKDYYEKQSLEMLHRIETQFSFKKTIEDLNLVFNRAIFKFEERN